MKVTHYLCISSFLLSSCATVTKGSHEDILVITEPPGAKAESDILIDPERPDNGYRGCEPTPCIITLGRRQEAVIDIHHKDFAPFETAVFTDIREVRDRREKTRETILNENQKAGAGWTAGYLAGASLTEFGTIILPSTGPAVVLLGSAFYTTAGSYALLADATDTLTGASNSLYPNPLAVRLTKDAALYPQDPNVVGVRQRRSKPSPKKSLKIKHTPK